MRKYLLFLIPLSLLVACKSPPPQPEAKPRPEPLPPVVEQVVPQRIVEPELVITSITILQADLVNTRFRITFKIVNPNPFPVFLSNFRYELHGDGRFWANGTEKNLAIVSAESSLETNINLEMNFINMRRQLLDDIIAMREVRYRVVGSVEAETDTAEIPGIRMDFDFSGTSAVRN
jgi:LEA14-like dessication related protein